MGKETNNCFYSINYYKGNVSCFLLFPCPITKLCSWLQPLVPPWGEDTAPPCRAASHTALLWAVQCSPHYCSSAQQNNTVLQLCTTKQHSTAALYNKTTYSTAALHNKATYSTAALYNKTTYSTGALHNKATYSTAQQAAYTTAAVHNKATYRTAALHNKAKYSAATPHNKVAYSTAALHSKAT